ncbi:MAG: hypothetical protein KU37_11630 [Sulfuricurvum sp. PC08-66]|nr:MAG: hypothetical protein KU37_11630 [Sulfuricurvum sp. PC08-66]
MKAFNISIDKLQPVKFLTLTFLLFFIFEFFFLLNSNEGGGEIFLYYFSFYSGFVYLFWLWMMGVNLISLRNTKNVKLFHVSFLILMSMFAIHLLTVSYYLMSEPKYHDSVFELLMLIDDKFMVDDWSFVLNIAIGFISFFLAKNLREIEEGRALRFREYYGTFLLIFLFPVINIFFIQPRIKKVMDRYNVKMINYTKIENIFIEILSEIDTEFSQDEIVKVNEYLEHCEYGLALDVIVAIIVEEQKQFSDSVIQLIKKLMKEMSMEVSSDSGVYEYYLNLNLLSNTSPQK